MTLYLLANLQASSYQYLLSESKRTCTWTENVKKTEVI